MALDGMTRGVVSVTIIVIGNRIGRLSSNPGQGCLRFTLQKGINSTVLWVNSRVDLIHAHGSSPGGDGWK